MRRSSEFHSVIRCGVRVPGRTVLVHHLPGLGPPTQPPRVGLVVGRQIGSSVVRHRITRRLRAQLAARLGRLPCGSGTVVRALPDAVTASSETLGTDLDHALGRVLR
jgi:ribonuclease P protein component